MKLPLDRSGILEYEKKYFETEKRKKHKHHYADECIEKIQDAVKKRKRRYLTKSELKTLALWKVPTKRTTLSGVKLNCNAYIKKMTRTALDPKTSERDRIKLLQCLQGVGWAVASAILHWFHQDCYPIWDVRALKTVNSPTNPSQKRWEAYVCFCRCKAEKNNVSMRTLDRALWQYDESQSKKTKTEMG